MAGIITVPLHIGDFLSGTLHMDTLEKGAYLMLILAHYQAGEQGLPNDDKQLARIAGVSPKIWLRIKDTLAKKFQISDQSWVSERCVEVLKEVHGRSEAQRQRAKKRFPKVDENVSRRETKTFPKENTNQLILLDGGHAAALPEECQPKPKPKPKDKSNDLSAIEFENEFWPLAEKKVGKDAARKAFAKARERAALGEIIPAWRAMNSHWAAKKQSEEWQFVPHPATWLNDGRWQDELVKPRTGGHLL